jgi:acyl-CoA reductase-like NAD-dependent aldehyde dehydrogenase
MTATTQTARLFIGGHFRPATQTVPVIEAATGEPIGDGPSAGHADAVGIANASQYGLAGTVWSTDAERATDVARAVRTGTIGVNNYLLDMRAPFGGVKASGLGRELGPEGLDEYLVVKSIYRA